MYRKPIWLIRYQGTLSLFPIYFIVERLSMIFLQKPSCTRMRIILPKQTQNSQQSKNVMKASIQTNYSGDGTEIVHSKYRCTHIHVWFKRPAKLYHYRYLVMELVPNIWSENLTLIVNIIQQSLIHHRIHSHKGVKVSIIIHGC